MAGEGGARIGVGLGAKTMSVVAIARLALALIMITYLGLTFLYARSVPKWNAPDEPAHYNYVKTIAQTGTFPVLQVGDYDQAFLEKATTAKFPDSLPIDGVRYESHQPPLYYLLATPLFWLSSGSSLSVRVLVLRLLSTLFGVLTIATTHAIGRKLFPENPVLPLAAAAFVAFVPMHVFMTAAINNDSLADLLLSVLVLVLVTSLQRGRVKRQALVFIFDREAALWGVILGLSLLTKVTTDIGIGMVAFVVLWQEIIEPRLGQYGALESERLRPIVMVGADHPASQPSSLQMEGAKAGRPLILPGAIRRIALRLGQAYAIALVIAGWWLVRNALVYGNLDLFGLKRQDLVVIGQPLTGPLNFVVIERFVVMTFQSFWGVFGWMGILMDQRIYVGLAILSVVSIIGLLMVFVRGLAGAFAVRGRAANIGVWGLLVLDWVLLFAGVAQYNLVYIQTQGRYFFPAIAPIAIFFVVGLRQFFPTSHLADVGYQDRTHMAVKGETQEPISHHDGVSAGAVARQLKYQALAFGTLFTAFAFLDLLALYRFIIPQFR